MRIVYYSRPSYLDNVLPHVEALARLADLHLFVELVPELWNNSLFDISERSLPSGVIPGDPVFREFFPQKVHRYWDGCANFFLVVHNCRRTFHPSTYWVSHKAAKMIRSLKADILHLNDISPRLAITMTELRKLPLVLTIHDPSLHTGEANWRDALARRLIFPGVRKFILHSRSFKESFAAMYGIPVERVDHIPLGVFDIFREWIDVPLRSDEKTVLFFGRLSPYKGLEVLYNAARMIAERVQNVRFIVAGKPVRGYEPPVPPQLPGNSNIEVMDTYLTNRQVAELFQRASVVVCPYIEATQSGVVLTAYAFDKPVIATHTGGLPEYVQHGETGLLVPPKDALALAEALERILKDGNLRSKLTAGIKRTKEGLLSWNSIAERTLQVYEKALHLEKQAGIF